MARFLGSVKGSAGETSRVGHSTTGLDAHIRGWNIGIRIRLSVNSKDQDVIHVWKTSGSAGRQPDELLTTIVEGKE